ncbi:MAG TPA: hypothetical protein VFP84_21220 [Kofleriaceae bacterium]|nr:hypothetical protein [Kofleriaceae bacterium]
MQPLTARVRNGRIFLDAPTDLPEGEIQLVPVQHAAGAAAEAGDDLDGDLDDAERAALDRELEASFDDGPLIDASDAIADLRSVR